MPEPIAILTEDSTTTLLGNGDLLVTKGVDSFTVPAAMLRRYVAVKNDSDQDLYDWLKDFWEKRL